MKTIGMAALVIMLIPCSTAVAERAILVAVAANFIKPMRELSYIFEKENGISIKSVFASTGALYSQIRQEALFALFLAADLRRPELLHCDGLARRPIVYAVGTVVLWTSHPRLCAFRTWQELLRSDPVRRIAMPNPATAPYGEAAAYALRGTGLMERAKSILVYGQSVSQAFQFAWAEGADAAFTALAYTMAPPDDGEKGYYWQVSEARPVVQA